VAHKVVLFCPYPPQLSAYVWNFDGNRRGSSSRRSECQLGSGLVFSAHDDRLVERRGSIPTDGSVDAAPAARTGLSACRVWSPEVLQYTPLWGLQLTAGHYVFEMWARADPSPTALQKVHLSVHTHAESVPPIAETTMSLTPSYSEGRLEFDVP